MPTYIPNYGCGYLSYGDADTPLGGLGVYIFPPTYQLSMSSKPVMSDNKASVKYIRNELTVTWYVPWDVIKAGTFQRPNPPGSLTPNTIDTAIQQIRQILMQPRKRLVCRNNGLGPEGPTGQVGFDIIPEDDRDGGPLPLDFKASNIVAQKCIQLTWVVAFHTYGPITFNSTNALVKNPSDYNEVTWNRSFDHDELGNATITTTGKIEYAGRVAFATQVEGNGIAYKNIVDALIGINFPVPVYCQRISNKYSIDESKKVVNFTIIDKQLPWENPLPERCLRIDMTHELSSTLFGKGMESSGFHRWNNVIQGSITLPAGEPFVTAYYMFWFIARQRLARLETNGVAGATKTYEFNEQENEEELRTRNIITKISYTEDLFGRTHRFRVEYTGVYDKYQLIQQSGIFTPLYNYKQDPSGTRQPWYNFSPSLYEPWHQSFNRDGNDYKNWLQSQWSDYTSQFGGPPNYDNKLNSWSIFGNTNYTEYYNAYSIFIPDEQNEDKELVPLIFSGERIKGWMDSTQLNTPGTDETGVYTRPKDERIAGDDLEKTYIAYEFSTDFYENHNTFQFVRQKYEDKINRALRSFGDGPKPEKQTAQFGFNNAYNAGVSDVPSSSDYTSSYNSQSNMMVVLSGYAIRIAAPPVIPSLFTVGNKSVIRAGTGYYSMSQIGSGHIPVYLAKWSIPYYVDENTHSNVFANLVSNGLTGVLT